MTASPKPTIVWLRHDLRLQDQPAFKAALRRKEPIVPLYIYDEWAEGKWAPGAASRWWLHHALASLSRALEEKGLRLVLRRGKSLPVLRKIIRELGADTVYWCRRFEPHIRNRDTALEKVLCKDGLTVERFNGSLLFEPWDIANKSGKPYQVFTAFWKTCLAAGLPAPVKAEWNAAQPPLKWPLSDNLSDWRLLPSIPWDQDFYKTWEATLEGAVKNLRSFSRQALAHYSTDRDRPDLDNTSRLSPYLHFGQIGPRQVVASILKTAHQHHSISGKYIAELGWRDFSYHLLYHFPNTTENPLRPQFKHFPWNQNPELLSKWQQGLTGYPLVDAGMRQLWATGWMHNRVRMVTASFLVKHLLQPWQDGAAWFWDTLVDADLASNTQGWQWTAGCGADAAPYFRVFNPITQGEKFDPQGTYIRRWIPALAKLEAPHIHRPWKAPQSILEDAGIRLDQDYPTPVVDHAQARNQALRAFDSATHPSHL